MKWLLLNQPVSVIVQMQNEWQRQIRIFLAALTFYSRIPVASDQNSLDFMHASRYISLVGWCIGLISVLVWGISRTVFADEIALLLGMIIAIIITGAIHEDGFADTCDGLIGGWTPEDRLRIMKDSCIGSYGATGLVLLLILRYNALLQIEVAHLPWIWIAGHALSRMAAISLLKSLPYVQKATVSKSKAMTELSTKDWSISIFFGILPLFFIEVDVWSGLLSVTLAWWSLKVYFYRRLGGITGDCLGATQQICEVFFYLALGASFV